MNPKKPNEFFSVSTFVYVVAFVFVLWLSLNTLKVIERNYALEQEVDSLEEEVAILELQNQNLKYNIEYYKTDDYLEIAAKEKLNKRRSGESVVVFDRDEFVPSETSLASSQPEQAEQEADYQENFNAWWDFLFAGDNS